MVRKIASIAVLISLAACGSTQHVRAPLEAPHASSPNNLPAPRIVAAGSPSQCVPHARKISNIQIRGDAWTWWTSAKGNYTRASAPQIGSVLVLSKSDRLRLGHLAVVTHVVGSRKILVEHANWLNRGQVHKHQLVVDISSRGDWSAVRLWHTPSRTLGITTYPVSGFVLEPASGNTVRSLRS